MKYSNNKIVSVVVVNWNGKQHLKDCFSSLLKQTSPRLEIIMVDNASNDGSVNFMKENFPEVKLIQNNTNIGFGPAVNRGIAESESEYLIFLNNDLSLEPDCISELLKSLEKPNVGGAIPKILMHGEKDKINSFGVDVNYVGIACPRYIYEKDSDSLKEEEVPCGGIFIVHRDLVEKLEGFDESIFFYHEDHDLSWRLRLLGMKLIVNPKAVIYHKYHFSRHKDKFYYSEKNRLYLLLKNYSLKTLMLIFPAILLVEIAELYFALAQGWFVKKIKSYFELLIMSPTIIKKRIAIQSKRAVKDREIVRILTGRLVVGGIKNPLLENILSPVINLYWKLIKEFV
tara:strand:- start:28558 stop:29583 length:1026 start_codon:yes stop_codon:yes gene_type:complete